MECPVGTEEQSFEMDPVVKVKDTTAPSQLVSDVASTLWLENVYLIHERGKHCWPI